MHFGLPARHHVRYPLPLQAFFQNRRLPVGPVQHGHVLKAPGAPLPAGKQLLGFQHSQAPSQPADLLCHKNGFGPFAVRLHHPHWDSLGPVGL